MKVLNLNRKENKEIINKINELLEVENIKGEIKLSTSEELKGAIYIHVWAENIKSINKAIQKSIKLNKEIDKIFPDKYIVISIHPM